MKQLLLAVFCGCAAASAHANESEELLKKAQGTWAREVTESTDPTDRMVKHIDGNKETFSIFKGDKLTYQQTVDFEIEVREGVTVFTLRGIKVTAGAQKGHESEGEFSYLFQIRGDKWIEVQGLMNGDQATPKLSVYERVDAEQQP